MCDQKWNSKVQSSEYRTREEDFFHSEKEISEQETNQKKKWWKIMPLAEAGCNDCCYLIFYLSLLF